ncbi:acyl-CoA dehydrogenase family protein [Tropicimonas sp. IMCC34043]|uniref:acyl-CoA dehydrogenase family protein n=1 Tax=Tropicimonas sp. IMCC34043 TaxID=2248760 RepID=UPI000E24B6EC|nr:acyl-CoA dehydrogenase [Tropicimonas sp. IMCC34043]
MTMQIRFEMPSDEALLLKDMAERFVADHYSLAQRSRMLAAPATELPAHWPRMADLGWLGAALPEACGGLGLSPQQVLPLIEVLGAGLVLEPVTPATLQCATVIARLLPEDRASDVLAPILAGQQIEVLVAGPDGMEPAVSARPVPGGWELSGTVRLVPGGAAAAAFWVAVDIDGAAVLRVPAAEAEVTAYRLLDGQAAASVCFDGVLCPPDACWTGARAALDAGAEMALFGALAETSGLVAALLRATLDHVKLREQFGRPIGRFQTVQHRLADMYICREEVRSMVQLAAEAMAGEASDKRRRLLSAAKVKTGDCARAVVRDAIQFHGGMGMTDELAVGHMVKRLLVLGQAGGTRAGHLTAFSAAS